MIDEKKLIAGLKEYIEEYSALDENGMHNLKWCAMMEALELVEQQEKVGEWIPCSEDLPKEEGSYLVSTRNNAVTMTHYYPTHKRFSSRRLNNLIVAWMPRPEPYYGQKIAWEDQDEQDDKN